MRPGTKIVKGNRLRPPAIVSDSDEDELDQRALSPCTRMSITGVRPQDLGDDDSEIEYSDEVSKSPVPPSGREDAAASRYRQAIEGPPLSPRYSTQFVGNIEETLHSTIFPVTEDVTPHEESSGSDVLILSNKETPIEISSSSADDDVVENKENISGPPFVRPSRSYSPRTSAGAPAKTTKNLSQPTIQAALQQSKSRVKSEDHNPNQKLVSQDDYDKELRNLSKLRVELTDAEKLYEKVANKLPDKGIQITKRIENLRLEIVAKSSLVDSLQIQTPKIPAIRVMDFAKQTARPLQDNSPDWDELSAAVNQIKPVYTGTQGMATFNNQKALTLESLKVRL